MDITIGSICKIRDVNLLFLTMSTLVTGFEYDIFISYCHNDNLDGWVTQFVENLEKELRSTLMVTITI